ncbi:MAG TPA: family 1 glycosylhydrolase [Pedobacter sp.]|jgi:dTDP-4-dehydrorhamnose reductase
MNLKNELINDNVVEIWGGIECTINRVKDQYLDQLEYSGLYTRESDLDLVASLGIKTLRYPVLWEKHQKRKDTEIDWSFADRSLNRLRALNVSPIAGLVHHGSGPEFVNFYDGSFESGLAEYAKKVAERYPWIEYYTPVNEPLTTARFCGLYGHWYPHKSSKYDFFKILLSECKATVMAMKAIREINPHAKLIQTDDLGKCHSTDSLKYQADLENERRWISYELLCGKLTPAKFMWNYMLEAGIGEDELYYFLDNNCPPDVCGFNYYLTSERYLDENLSRYPKEFHGGNEFHKYADVHTTLVNLDLEGGPSTLLKEAWERLGRPLAITECHLHSQREEQMRWFNEMWQTVNQLKSEGVDIRAVTAWALFGLYGWNTLCTKPFGDYEPGVFNISSGVARPTALARYIKDLTENRSCSHPVLDAVGWWKRETRTTYYSNKVININPGKKKPSCAPVIILGRTGTLGSAFSKICDERHIHHVLLGRDELDIRNKANVKAILAALKPWAIINTAGYVKVDEAETEITDCYQANCQGPSILAKECANAEIKFLTFSSDLVFDGNKKSPYTESDPVSPLNIYGKSKAQAEAKILELNPDALVVRTSSFFGPWDEYNFAFTTLLALKESRKVHAANDVYISPTYVPDLVNECLNCMLDGESGILHLTNQGVCTWADFAKSIAQMAGYDPALVVGVPSMKMNYRASRPKYSALTSEKGLSLPPIDEAIERFLESRNESYILNKIAG